jgi:hypothetical protein
MQAPVNPSHDSPIYGSPETIYLAEIMGAIRELRWCFKDKDIETFSLYVEFLRNAILSDEVIDSIDTETDALKKELEKKGITEHLAEFRLGFLVVRKVFKYLNSSFDLTHEDIIGLGYDLEGLPDLISVEGGSIDQ